MSTTARSVLHRSQGKDIMEVVDDGDIRTLYFGDGVVQSRLSLQEPHRLLLKYTRYMVAASLLIRPSPKKILLIGVGAGSLLHFFNHFLPKSQIDAVDYSREVLSLARGYFNLPENNNITIHCNDGFRFLSTRSAKKDYDLILLDAFNDRGMAKNIYCSDFFRLAGSHLGEEGIICANLWCGNELLFNTVKKAIDKNCRHSLFFPVQARENVIALLLRQPPPWKDICASPTTLNNLSSRYGFLFAEVAAAIRKNNMKLADRMRYIFH